MRESVNRYRISSNFTLVYQILPPLVLAAAAILAIVSELDDPLHPDDEGVVAAVTLIGITLACLLWFGRLKTVRVSEKILYVSSWLSEISIPLTDIEYVYYFGAGRAAIRLKSVLKFGRTINFLAPLRVFDFSFVSHPVVDELREMVKAARDSE